MDDEAARDLTERAVRNYGRRGVLPSHLTVADSADALPGPAVAAALASLLASGRVRWRNPARPYRVVAASRRAARDDEDGAPEGLW